MLIPTSSIAQVPPIPVDPPPPLAVATPSPSIDNPLPILIPPRVPAAAVGNTYPPPAVVANTKFFPAGCDVSTLRNFPL